MSDLTITLGDLSLSGTWNGRNRDVRDALRAALPVEGNASKWGDELYMTVPVNVEPTDTQTTVEPGTIAYWPAGPAFCLFWGPTPASTDDRPAAASPVAPVATLEDIAPLDNVDSSMSMRIAAND